MTDPTQDPNADPHAADARTSVMQLAMADKTPPAGRDPIHLMQEIARDQSLTPEDRAMLIRFAGDRFKNRRFMAYACLWTLIGTAILLMLAAFVDGLVLCSGNAPSSCHGILATIEDSQALFIWVDGFLTAIVGAYYGVSAWRPSS